jgi:hypothetical protein
MKQGSKSVTASARKPDSKKSTGKKTARTAAAEKLLRREIVSNARLASALRKYEIAGAQLNLTAAMCRSY